jgi:pyrroline-5-carboxylate reductase
MKNIGFLGAGNMGGAIIKGSAGKNSDLAYFAYDMDAEKLKALEAFGVKAVQSEIKLTENSDYLFLAMKPQQFGGALRVIAPALRDDTVLVSIGAGISGSFIRERIGKACKIVLAMPNTPLLLGEGATALARLDGVSDEEFETVRSVFDCCGVTALIPEDKMKEIICINSSSPAFIYHFADTIIKFGVNRGISEEAVKKLFAQALIGSAKMIEESGYSLRELISMVSSPGGTTVAGLGELQAGNFEETVTKACEACTNRAYELGK